MSERVMALIPALDGASLIASLVAEARPYVERVVVVDDGSTDGTSEAARAAGATVIRHEVNRGKGAALKTGFAYALENGFDGVVTLDADGQHLPADIPKLLARREETGADLIIGDRSHLFADMLPRRRMANRFSAWAIARGSGAPITDSQSGFRFYSCRMLRAIRFRTDGFDLESEAIVRAAVGGFKISTTPIELGFVDGHATSHYKPLPDTLRILFTSVRARFLWR